MSRYAAAHKNTSGPGDARPKALQIISDDNLTGALQDKTLFLIGASASIGIDTGRALAATGARLFLGGRSVEKTQQACAGFLEPGRVTVIRIDMASLRSVRAAVDELLAQTDRLNVLVNNAGIMACPESESEDGFELQFATNYLGPFLTFALLEKTLLASATPEWPSRVVNVSSSGHQRSGIHFENINLKGEYVPLVAYGQSKTAMIYMTNQIGRLYGVRNLHGLSVMPGGIMTSLQQHLPDELKASWAGDPEVQRGIKNAEQGAATTVIAAVGKEWHGRGGRYLEDCQEAVPVDVAPKGARGYAAHIHNEEIEARLWTESQKWVNQPVPN